MGGAILLGFACLFICANIADLKARAWIIGLLFAGVVLAFVGGDKGTVELFMWFAVCTGVGIVLGHLYNKHNKVW